MKNYIFFLISLCILLGACTDKNYDPGANSEEREVEMNFIAPTTDTRAPIEAEKSISDLTLLVFEGNGDQAVFQYSRSAWRTSSGANSFKTTLKLGSNLTIYFAVNAKSFLESLDADVLVEGNTWDEISKKLVMNTPTNIKPQQGLPMWAVRNNETITEKPSNHLGTIPLLRSVASADIYFTGNNFTLQEGFLAFAANKGYLAFDPGKVTTLNGKMSATAPYCPTDMVTSIDLNHIVKAGESSIANIFYMYENDSPLEPTAPDKRPTKIVLKGVWNDPQSSGVETYYPLSLRNKDEGTGEFVKKKVTRNNKYTVIVSKVNGDGFGSLEEAKDADDVNVDYDVIDWNDNEDGDLIIDGPKFFYREASHIRLSRDAGKTGKIILRTNYDLNQISMKFTSGPASVSGVIDTHERFKAEIVTLTDNHSGTPYNCFRFTTKQQYGTSNNPDTLHVTVGRMGFNITVEQMDSDSKDWNNGGNVNGDLG